MDNEGKQNLIQWIEDTNGKEANMLSTEEGMSLFFSYLQSLSENKEVNLEQISQFFDWILGTARRGEHKTDEMLKKTVKELEQKTQETQKIRNSIQKKLERTSEKQGKLYEKQQEYQLWINKNEELIYNFGTMENTVHNEINSHLTQAESLLIQLDQKIVSLRQEYINKNKDE